MRRPLGALVLALAACAGDHGARGTPRPPLFDSSQPSSDVPSPALWRYHPSAAAAMNVRVPLDANTTLYAGARGERWLSSQGARTVTAAPRLAPEELIAVQRLGEGGWLFLGASGSAYTAKTPLGPFLRSSAPLEKLSRVTASGTSLLGVRREGSLVRSADGGASWGTIGPDGRRFVDVVVAADGRGLALAVPEELWHTTDHGQTWRPAGTPTVAGSALGLGAQDTLLVQGALGERRFVPGPPARLELVGDSASRRRQVLPFAPQRGPDAGALVQGRALRLDGRYLELGSQGGGVRMLEGPLFGPLRPVAVAALDGCRDARLAAFGDALYMACLSGPDPSQQRVTFFKHRGSFSFEREPYEAVGNAAQFRMAVGQGALVVTGICAAHETSRGCLPRGVHHLRPHLPRATKRKPDVPTKLAKRPAYELAPAAAPALGLPAAGLAFSTDGRTAYALGRRSKAGEYALFVSRDGGRTFTPRALDDLPPEYASLGGAAGRPARAVHDPVAVDLEPADDGTLAIVLTVNGRSLLVVTDAEGRIVSMSNPPGDNSLVGAWGSRALAVSVQARQAWETLDGGASWQSVGRLPADVCPGDVNCVVPVACAEDGCVVGHELTRRGWRGQGDDDSGVLVPPERAQVGLAVERKLRTPLSCTLEAAAWKDLPGAVSAPGADQSAIGKADWFTIASDDSRASVGLLHGYGGGRARVEAVTLLGPAPRPGRYAVHASLQVEGVAALRYPTPESRPGETELRDIEIAWNNLFEGRVVHARIPDAGVYRPGDYERGEGGTQRARPNLLSITSGGLYARIHATTGTEQPTFFLDGKSVREVPAPEWPKNVIERSHRELTHVGGAHVPVAFFGNGAALLRARRTAGAWTFDGISTGLERPKDFDLTQHHDLGYVGSTPGLQVLLYSPTGRFSRGLFFPFRADGAASDAPIPVPAQLDASDPPAACSDGASATPRLIVPFQAGSRHAVVVSDASEPLRLLVTSNAVMRGTPAQACVAAFDAEVVKTDLGAEPQSESAILPLADLEHAWLFRVLRSADSQRATVQYRNMSCRFDAKAEVPQEAFRLPGVTTTVE